MGGRIFYVALEWPYYAANPFEILVLKNRFGRLVTASLIIELKSGYIRDQGVFGK